MTRKERIQKKGFKRLYRSQEAAIVAKLQANEKKYQFGEGWRGKNWKEYLQLSLAEHVQKGDPKDVVILGLFALYHGWPTAERAESSLQLNVLVAWNLIRELNHENDYNFPFTGSQLFDIALAVRKAERAGVTFDAPTIEQIMNDSSIINPKLLAFDGIKDIARVLDAIHNGEDENGNLLPEREQPFHFDATPRMI